MIHIPNSKTSDAILRKTLFEGSNTFAIYNKHYYILYSYGFHFPMYAYNEKTNQWYYNTDKYSRTTSKHQSQLRPPDLNKNKPAIGMNTEELIAHIDKETST